MKYFSTITLAFSMVLLVIIAYASLSQTFDDRSRAGVENNKQTETVSSLPKPYLRLVVPDQVYVRGSRVPVSMFVLSDDPIAEVVTMLEYNPAHVRLLPETLKPTGVLSVIQTITSEKGNESFSLFAPRDVGKSPLIANRETQIATAVFEVMDDILPEASISITSSEIYGPRTSGEETPVNILRGAQGATIQIAQ